MSDINQRRNLDTPHLTPPPSYGKAKPFRKYFKERLPRMTQETEPEEFLKQILPFSLDNAEAILKILKKKKLYDHDGKFWPGLRVTDETQPGKRKREIKEVELYQPFVEITQTIAKNTEKYQGRSHLPGTWVGTHNKSPTTSNPDSDIVLIPDVCFAYEDPLPTNPGGHGESQGNNVSAICVLIGNRVPTQLSMTLEAARSLPLAPGIYCGRDQDRLQHRTGSIVHLCQPSLHGMY